MLKIKERKAGDFIDLDNYFTQINDEEIDLKERDAIAIKFLSLLLGKNYIKRKFLFFFKKKI